MVRVPSFIIMCRAGIHYIRANYTPLEDHSKCWEVAYSGLNSYQVSQMNDDFTHTRTYIYLPTPEPFSHLHCINPHRLPTLDLNLRESSNMIMLFNMTASICTHLGLYLIRAWQQAKPGYCPEHSDLSHALCHWRSSSLMEGTNTKTGVCLPACGRKVGLMSGTLVHPLSFQPLVFLKCII
jgi:hypothetical protein